MALIKCAECGKEISDKAAACPGCGAPVAVAPKPLFPPASQPAPPASSIAPSEATRVVRAGLRYEAIGFFLIIGAIVLGLAGLGGFAGFVGFVGFIVFMVGRFID